MPATIREQIAATLKTTLQGIGGVTVKRNPLVDFDMVELPALGLFVGDQNSAIGETIDVLETHMTVMVVAHVTGADGEAAEIASHVVYGQVVTAIMADPTISALAIDTTEVSLVPTSNAGADGEPPLIGFELTFDVLYRTDAAAPTALASG